MYSPDRKSESLHEKWINLLNNRIPLENSIFGAPNELDISKSSVLHSMLIPTLNLTDKVSAVIFFTYVSDFPEKLLQ